MLTAFIGLTVLFVGAFLFFIFADKAEQAEGEIPLEEVTSEGLLPSNEGKADEGLETREDDDAAIVADIVVDVKGAVKNPGIYHLPPDSRVYQAIEAAGGATEEADVNRLNLADFLTDGVAVVVPVDGEDPVDLAPMTGSVNGGGQTGGKVNVNRATEEELQTLPGIGPAKAAAIIRDREENGPFKTVDDLTRVSGIGEKTLENMRENVTVK